MNTMTMDEIRLAGLNDFDLNLKVYKPPHDYIYYFERPPNAAIFFERDAIPDGVALFDWDTGIFTPCTRDFFDRKMAEWFGKGLK